MSGQLTCSGKVIDLLLRFNFDIVGPFGHQSASYIVGFHNVLQSDRREESYLWFMFHVKNLCNNTYL